VLGDFGTSRPISRAKSRGSTGHASNNTTGGIRRATYRNTRATTITSSRSPMMGRNSGIKSIGEMTQISARTLNQRALRGTAGCCQSRRIVVAHAGRNAASSHANPGGSRFARTISTTHEVTISATPMRIQRSHTIVWTN